jgi:hypothetical protein
VRHLDVTKTSLRRKKSRRRIQAYHHHQPIFTSQASSEILCNLIQSCSSPDSPLSLNHSSTPRPPWPTLESGHRVTCITPPLATPPNGIASSPLFSPPDGAGARPTASQPPQTANSKRIKAINRRTLGTPPLIKLSFLVRRRGPLKSFSCFSSRELQLQQ